MHWPEILQKPFTRRTLLTGTASACAVVAAGQALDLKPGEFEWHPEAAPEGPVAVIASLPDQLVHVYRNEVRIGRSTCSTGKPGHSTPTGIFTILQKDAHHHSSTYNNAPMPNMNRLTWSGVALHAPNLPGCPASHGCVRLPLEFSKLLFSVTHVGTPVIIADLHSDGSSVWERFKRGPGPTLGYYQAILDPVRMKLGGHPIGAGHRFWSGCRWPVGAISYRDRLGGRRRGRRVRRHDRSEPPVR